MSLAACVYRSLLLFLQNNSWCACVYLQVPSSGRRFLHSDEGDTWVRLAGPLAADDPKVLHILLQDFLTPPSALPYNFSNSKQRGSRSFTWPWIYDHLVKLFGGQQGGFFVEAGALDGEYLSNTLWLERDLGWTGLLVEPDEDNYKMLTSKHRRAWTSNTCLSSEGFPKRTIMVSTRLPKASQLQDFWWAFRGHTHELHVDIPKTKSNEKLTDSSYVWVQCFPLLSYLLAINITSVDLLSLDVQGSEMGIVRTLLNSSRVSVRVVVVEDESKTFDHGFMASHGYVLVASDLDHVYVKRGDPALHGVDVPTTTASSTSSSLPPLQT